MTSRRKIDRDVIRIGITHAVQVYRGIQASPLRIDPSGNIITLHARITDWCCSETAKCLEFWESGVPLGQGEFPGALDLITKSDKIRPILQSPSDQRSGGFRRSCFSGSSDTINTRFSCRPIARESSAFAIERADFASRTNCSAFCRSLRASDRRPETIEKILLQDIPDEPRNFHFSQNKSCTLSTKCAAKRADCTRHSKDPKN